MKIGKKGVLAFTKDGKRIAAAPTVDEMCDLIYELEWENSASQFVFYYKGKMVPWHFITNRGHIEHLPHEVQFGLYYKVMKWNIEHRSGTDVCACWELEDAQFVFDSIVARLSDKELEADDPEYGLHRVGSKFPDACWERYFVSRENGTDYKYVIEQCFGRY